MGRLSLNRVGTTLTLSVLTILGVVLNGANHAKADTLPVVYVSGTLTSSQTWSAGSVYMITSTITIPDGVTLTIDAGAIIKNSYSGIHLNTGATLNATGTAANPVEFTSVKDDNLGGDSNGDGTYTSPGSKDYVYAIENNNGGTVTVSHASFSHTASAVNTSCSSSGGNTSIADSELQAGVYIDSCTANQVSLLRNHFAVPNGVNYPIALQNSQPNIVQLTGTNKNTFTGSGLSSAVSFSGTENTVPAGITWDIDNTSGAHLYLYGHLKVSGTVNLGTGTLVKILSNGIHLNTGGVLNATGTAANPVEFTSVKDDSIGGDSNGDGTYTSPGNTDYVYAIENNNGGTVIMSHIDFGHTASAVNTSCNSGGSTALTDSELRAGVYVDACTASQVSLLRNHFAVPNGVNYPVALQASQANIVRLTGVDKNTFTGTGRSAAISFSGNDNIVPTGATWNVDSTSGAHLFLNGQLKVSGTLTFGTGSLVKTQYSGIHVNSGGTLNAMGTTTNPAIFTSTKDDTGGDSNGDGTYTSPGNTDYIYAIENNNGGTVTVSHANFSHTASAVNTNCASASSTTLTDSDLRAGVYVDACTSSQVSLLRNHFAVPNGINYPIALQNSQPNIVQLTGTNKNTFTGTGRSVAIFFSGSDNIVPASTIWSVDNSSGAHLYLYGQFKVNGTLNLGTGALVKVVSTGIHLNPGAILSAAGTTTNPVVLTSAKDDSIGGDSNGDDSYSSPGHTDYTYGVEIVSGSTLNMSYSRMNYSTSALSIGGDATIDHTTVQHGATGLSAYSSANATITNATFSDLTTGLMASNSAEVVYRGNFDNIGNKAVVSCNWGDDCSVDATYTDWGSDNGPTLSGNSLVCGQVTTLPWVHGGSTHSGSLLFVNNCDSSDTPDQGLGNSVSYFQIALDAKTALCNNGDNDACTAVNTTIGCMQGARNLAAANSPIPLPQINSTADVGSAWSTAFNAEVTDYIRGEAEDVVLPTSAKLALKVESVLNIYPSMSSAYNQCAP